MLLTRKFIVTIVAAKVTVNAQCEQNQKRIFTISSYSTACRIQVTVKLIFHARWTKMPFWS
ncbi:conserved hypothetical protein [Pectobacterium atrosepticum SCRI1043]|uniref:Uncharacterized protein n=1 Tax=Pectobacterium atrosepticum (strain SCRI 1043 / ATCC BAA-672) TaxID=218491 RepID=Q6CZQ0_PECAS|nr:hypothetical protein CVS35_20410 [Pectobacterium atrosepticum]CAG76998.1 conserved hypothetical protein [Pectobacterium atrosepticum SCRI1043]GKV87215.1 hypothetical protein PEC301296_35260 [Pectobacterium carotovorum subsp. carotovorum]MCL6318420.1 hypothetical protein [Pectobacterium atrosepticum]MCL6322993.1 hypothetical protein [Pectobacterium atrosepticum]